MQETVAVIVPAYNAAATIDDTLHSVRAQTWRALEVVVVDDGSTDATAERARTHAAQDARIRYVRQSNQGVAAARNAGIAATASDFIATVDADDLWAPTKLETQMKAMREGGERVGLVYTWHSVIDARNRIIAQGAASRIEGDVFARICMGNFVGNGSAPLMRRDAIIEAGGYDPGLRAQGAQGCEDLKLYVAIAQRWRFALVPQRLTGYRWTRDNMSSDGRRMLRSYDLVMEPVRAEHGARLAAELDLGRDHIMAWLALRAARYGRFGEAGELLAGLGKRNPGLALRTAVSAPRRWITETLLDHNRQRPHFLTGLPL
ncbi:MAG: glycosyltransferase [Alphaproteobacteria bacterium]|nr:glycosyltransferase [Alphaproteobacteria bacterium]